MGLLILFLSEIDNINDITWYVEKYLILFNIIFYVGIVY